MYPLLNALLHFFITYSSPRETYAMDKYWVNLFVTYNNTLLCDWKYPAKDINTNVVFISYFLVILKHSFQNN